MPYSTDTDLYDRVSSDLVIQLTDDANTGVVNDTILGNIRNDISELIDTYLRARYTVPVDPTPAILTNIEADLLAHKLYTRRPNYEIPDSIKELKNDAMATLNKLASGAIRLDDNTPDPGASQILTNKTSTDRIFPSDILDTY